MTVLRQKEMRNMLAVIAVISFASVILGQAAAALFALEQAALAFLLITLLPGIIILLAVYAYFRRQLTEVDESIKTIEAFMNGDSEARLEDGREGTFSKLYHAVNRMATVLEAQAAKQKNTKDFLKDTISDISHQLKTPLAALNMYTEIMRDNPDDNDAVRNFTIKTQRELDRVEMLILNLLKITRLDAGAVVMNKSEQNVSELMNEIRLRFETRAVKELKNLVLSGDDSVAILCDRDWILEAVSNLVKNALDHTKEGGEVVICWNRLPAVTQIIIGDSGSGIHDQDIHHIFKRFYRSRFSKDSQGIGLGLPLAKSIVEANGGNITVESEPGRGSKFCLSFLNIAIGPYAQSMSTG